MEKKIKCFEDLINGIEHWNGTNQFANRYIKIDSETVEVQHVYRYGKDPKPFKMTRIDFNSWLNDVNKTRKSEYNL